MDMVYVTDVAEVLVTTLEHIERGAEFPDGTIEVGTGRPTTVMGIAQLVAREIDQTQSRAVGIEKLPMRPGEPPSSVVLADTSLLEQVNFDAKAFVKLEDGIEKTVDYYRGYLLSDR
jgi:nucleoside-diphosphate-sugar epimerase